MPNSKLFASGLGAFWEGLKRHQAIMAVLSWLGEDETGNDAPQHTFEALDALVQAASDTNHDGELDDVEQAWYSQVFEYVGDALVFLGGGGQAAAQFLNGESDDYGKRLAVRIKEAPDFKNKGVQDIIEDFITGGDSVETVSEAIAEELGIDEDKIEEKIQIKIKDGKKIIVKKRTKKRRVKASQLRGLRKHKARGMTAAVKRKWQKSFKKRKQLGMLNKK